MEIFLTVITGLAAVLLACVVLRLHARRVKGADKQRILQLWKAVLTVENLHMRVMNADVVLGKALEAAGYTGSVGEMLQKAGPRLQNENAVWAAHKLRNTIAHEPQRQVVEHEADIALKAFKKAIDDLL